MDTFLSILKLANKKGRRGMNPILVVDVELAIGYPSPIQPS